MKFKVLKTWVSKDFTIIFQASPLARKEDGLPKKVHLLLDLRQQSFGLRIAEDKPASATANHAFIQILRKNMPQFTLKEIFRDSQGDVYLPLLGGGSEPDNFWYIKLVQSRPPLASLVDPQGTIHVSFGQKGTFTKKHEGDKAPDWSSLESMISQLKSEIASLSHPRGAADNDAGLEEGEDQETEGEKAPISEEQKELLGRLRRKLKTTKKNLEKMRSDLPSEVSVSQAKLEAQHLQQYAYLIRPDTFELKLEALQTSHGEGMSIPLDPELSPGQNIEGAFQKSRKLEKKLRLGREQLALFEGHEKELLADIELLRKGPETDVFLSRIVEKYKLPKLHSTSSGSAPQTARPYKTYVGTGGYTILVGKGAKENDILTKSARANDYWFHATGVSGSHVIVPCTSDLRSGLPSQLMKEAAILALNSSRIKEDRAGECYVTRRSALKKQKNMPTGLWKVEQSETIYIRYTEEELQKILATIKA